jgi:hypothetical protein
MKVEYVEIPEIWHGARTYVWMWRCNGAESMQVYTRRRDAVRGFERFCAAIRGMK